VEPEVIGGQGTTTINDSFHLRGGDQTMRKKYTKRHATAMILIGSMILGIKRARAGSA